MYCIKCGLKIDHNSNYCSRCGMPTKTVISTLNQEGIKDSKIKPRGLIFVFVTSLVLMIIFASNLFDFLLFKIRELASTADYIENFILITTILSISVIALSFAFSLIQFILANKLRNPRNSLENKKKITKPFRIIGFLVLGCVIVLFLIALANLIYLAIKEDTIEFYLSNLLMMYLSYANLLSATVYVVFASINIFKTKQFKMDLFNY